MRKFLIFVGLCAVCCAAPGPTGITKEGRLDRPSPINPDVVSDPKPPTRLVLPRQDYEAKQRQQRDEAATAKSQNAPEKPHSIVALESLQHDPKKLHDKPLITPKPLLQKRDVAEKPHSVVAHESLQHNGNHHLEPAVLTALNEPHKGARTARDIPVPTQVKTTSAPKEEKEKPQVEEISTSRPESPLRHHPVPVAELFNKSKAKPATTSEESQESRESVESKDDKA